MHELKHSTVSQGVAAVLLCMQLSLHQLCVVIFSTDEVCEADLQTQSLGLYVKSSGTKRDHAEHYHAGVMVMMMRSKVEEEEEEECCCCCSVFLCCRRVCVS